MIDIKTDLFDIDGQMEQLRRVRRKGKRKEKGIKEQMPNAGSEPAFLCLLQWQADSLPLSHGEALPAR